VFGIEAPELLVLLVVGLLVFGPDRLPEMARQAGSWVRDLRRMVANARRDLSEGIGVDENDLRKLQNLNPKSYVRRNVLDGLDLDLGPDEKPAGRNGTRAGGRDRPASAQSGPHPAVAPGTVQPPFDPDTT
jgi:sec-independent protein translocase protein TatB